MVENKKQYSVLMSVYRKENPDFLRESMESIYNQTVPTNDFVLVCDGLLTKELDAVIDEMKEKFGKRLNVIREKDNHGLGYSLNIGVKKCKNELIARMDSDDVAVPDRIEKQLGKLKSNDFDVIGSNIAEYDENMKKCLSLRCVPERDKDIKKYARRRNPMNHMSVCFRKSKVLESGNYMDMNGFEDYYLWARMIQRGDKFYNIQENLIRARGDSSMLKRRGGRKYFSQMKEFERTLKKMKFISAGQYYQNVAIRSIFSLVPSWTRNRLYRKVLRRSDVQRKKGVICHE